MSRLPRSRITHVEALAQFLRRQPNIWVDGREFGAIGGCYGWRTRLSDLRRPPFNMRIANRQRRVRVDGREFIVSEYRFEPDGAAQQLTLSLDREAACLR